MPRSVDLPPDEEHTPDGTRAAGWWHESEDGRELICDLCPRRCVLAPGKRGFCFVRQNVEGRMVSTTYGRSTGFCIDPIEKKPLNQFYPGTAVLSFGTAGCNLGCKFCQNWTSSKSREVDTYCEVADPQAIATAALEKNCRSVAFTYNDPIVWAEYAVETARECRALGVKTVAVTSGYVTPAARTTLYEVMDAANVDLKGFTEEFYRELTGGHLEPVLDTLRWLVHQSDVWVEITNLIIPRANDSPEEIRRMCEWIAAELGTDVPLHFSAFHPDFRLTDRGPTPPETLAAAHDIARRAGLRYVYTGNVSDRRRQSTYCPNCGEVVIERDRYHLGVYALEGNRCRHCGATIAGRYDATVGNWGGGRMPVRIATFADRGTRRTDSKGGTRMNTEQSKPPQGEAAAPDAVELTGPEENLVFSAAGRRVAAVVRSGAAEQMDEVLGELGKRAVLGAFVSLKRGGQLRSCCGFMGESIPLHQAVDRAAVRAAQDDPRFPPISPTELEHLDMEVWLLWGMEPVLGPAEDRPKAITIGKHGLQISRGTARGLLLPGVAVDHKLDAEGFLQQVCLKAGLPATAWKDDDTKLTTFEGRATCGRLDPSPAPDAEQPPLGGPTSGELTALAEFCRQNVSALVRGATPNSYLPGGFDGGVHGLLLEVRLPEATETACSRISLRPELPLQSTLYGLVQAAAGELRSAGVSAEKLAGAEIGLSVLCDPAMHGAVAQVDLGGVDPRHRAVMVIQRSQWGWVYDPQLSADELLTRAIRKARLSEAGGAGVCSLAIISTDPKASATNVPRPQSGPDIRPAAVAGVFYPEDPDEIAQSLDQMFPKEQKAKRWAGMMVPHAGWMYSGKLAAETLCRAEFPPQAIIFCPKHARGGADWAVAPHRTWSLPGHAVDSDPDLAAHLAEAVSGLELDSVAHRGEHAIEVLLPMIARLAPQTRVVGVTVRSGDMAALEKFADQLAGLLRDSLQRPLLIISSDMNHFATDDETRRLDRLALDAIETLDPAAVYKTVTENRISMCGVYPAVIVMETLRRLDSLSRCESVGYATSAEASGDTRRVVGYAGMLFA